MAALANLDETFHRRAARIGQEVLERGRSATVGERGEGAGLAAQLFAGVTVPFFGLRKPANRARHQPIASTASARARGHVVLEIVHPVHDPEHRGMIRVRVVRELVVTKAQVGVMSGAGLVAGRQDARNPTEILNVSDRRTRKNPKVGVQLVARFGSVFQIVAMADRSYPTLRASRTPWVA